MGMADSVTGGIAGNFRRIVKEIAELPGLRTFARPLYRRVFRRPYGSSNTYYGVYETYAQAKAAADALRSLPSTYDTEAAGRMYRGRIEVLTVSDYPLAYWLWRLFEQGQRRVFDLGGHIGVSYYGFQRYIDYPVDMRWLVHDVPSVMEAGRGWAVEHDPARRLAFADAREDADGQDLLLSAGALQYLDYTLPELLRRLSQPPRHVLVNLTPMHPDRSYFTLQNLGIAICPYRIMARPAFIQEMEALGYRIHDRWESPERTVRIPFAPAYGVDRYYGFYFLLEDAKAGSRMRPR